LLYISRRHGVVSSMIVVDATI